MLKKFLIGTFAVVAFALVAHSALAAYDFGPTTLKVGSKGQYVMTLQTLVGATPVDGVFGPMTKAKVMAWQAANGLTADGVFGPMSKAKANEGGTTTCPAGQFDPMTGKPCGTTTPTVLEGGAGDLTVTASSKNTEDSIKEGTEEKVLSLKLEADDSDIQVTNLKLEFMNDSGHGSEKLTDYADKVKVYLGSAEVGSVDVSDMKRDSGSPDLYTKSIALSNAVVKDGDTDYLYVAVVASDDLDSSDMHASLEWTVTAESVRYEDGTGLTMTDETNESAGFNVTLASDDDKLDVKSSSANPDDTTVKVYENKTTDDVLALAFKLDNDEDSSDMDLQTIQVTADTSLTLTEDAAGVALVEDFIDSVVLKIAGEEFEAEDLVVADLNATGDIVTYTFEIDGDVTLDAGDVEEAKVYVSFYDQGTAGANYADDTTVEFAVDAADIEAEVDGDEVDSSDINGSQTGALLTVNSSAATVTGMRWSVNTTGTIIDFYFTVEAEDDDYTVATADIADTTSGTASFVDVTAGAGAPVTDSEGTLTKYSGDDVDNVSTTGLQVDEGEKTTFRLRYNISNTTNNMWAEVKITSVAGQTVDDDTQTSPTATTSGF